jgi:tetratricopeptide (TPR) repeat protein
MINFCEIAKISRKVLLPVAMLFFVSVFQSFAIGTPRLVPSSYIVFSEARGDDLTLEDSIDYSLLFSGVNTESLEAEASKVRSMIDEFKTEAEGYSTEKELAEAALVYLHRNVMKQYSENQTLVDVIFSTGKYNCVSSAVLYMILLQSQDIAVKGVKTVDHVFCKVVADEITYDVETTNEYGFDPGSKKDFKDSFGNVTGFSYVSPANYGKRKDITKAQLIEVILHNRISYLEKFNKYDEAVGLAVDAYSFTSGSDSLEILTNTIVNMGAWYNSKKLFTEGIDFFEKVLGAFGHSAKYDEVLRGLSYNKIVDLVDKKQFDEADTWLAKRYELGFISDTDFKDFSVNIALIRGENMSKSSFKDAIAYIDTTIKRTGENARLSEMKNSLVNNWMASLINGKKPDDAIKVLDELRSKNQIKESDYLRFASLAYQQKANLLSTEKGELAAAKYVQDIIAKIGSDQGLKSMYDGLIGTFEVKTHNRIVPLVNSKKYAEAKVILEEALQFLPGSKKIKADLDLVNKALSK